MRRIIQVVFLCVFAGFDLQAQWSMAPQTSQYMFSGQLINPAYSGSREVLSIALTGRKQWIGVDGAPWDATAGFNVPMFQNALAIGLMGRYEEIPDLKSTDVLFDITGRISVGSYGKISAGIRASYGMLRPNYQRLNLKDKLGDGVFSSDSWEVNEPNFGAGLFYYSARLYFGMSIPRLLPVGRSLGLPASSDGLNYLGTGGAYLKLGETVNLNPSFLISYQNRNGISVDLNSFLVLMDNTLWIGGSFRSSGVVVALLQFQVRQFKMGFSWDFPVGTRGVNNYGSPEYFIRNDFENQVYTGVPMFF